VLAAGCDDGTLVVLDYDVNSPMEVEIISEDKAHLKRIMSIWSHSKRKLIYTIGEDGMMKVFDLKAKNVTQEVTVSANKLTYMVCDPTTGFAFIADKAGMIKLYDLNVVSLIRRFSPQRILQGRGKLWTCQPNRQSEEWMLTSREADSTSALLMGTSTGTSSAPRWTR